MAPPPNSEPGAAQRWDPERYRRNAGFVPALGADVLQLLAPQAGERILDLGCGEGALTERIAAHAGVLGVDASADQVRAARARGLEARQVAGERLAFTAEFDAVFSNAALHWMPDADAVIDGVWRALKPGGRFVAEMGGAGNVAAVRDALDRALAPRGIDGKRLCPWYFPPPEDYRARLERCGFRVEEMRLIPRPTPLPGPLGDWLETFAESYLRALPPDQRGALKREVEELLKPSHCGPDGVWVTDYVRLRFRAVKPRSER